MDADPAAVLLTRPILIANAQAFVDTKTIWRIFPMSLPTEQPKPAFDLSSLDAKDESPLVIRHPTTPGSGPFTDRRIRKPSSSPTGVE
jgi:hypothetical protein